MFIKNCNSKLNFGWEGPTHTALSQAAANKVNKEVCPNSPNGIFNVQNITYASILPDKEKHEPGSHSANIMKLRDGDAFASFKKYDKKIKELIQSGNIEKLDENIGRALHYLQDMMNPFHVIYKQKFSKTEKDFHKMFEKQAILIQHDTISQAKLNIPGNDIDFMTFLKEKMNIAKEKSNQVVNLSLKHKVDFTELQKETLTDSYQITYKYLKNIAKIMLNNLA